MSNREDNSDASPHYKILGFRIERKTDILAATAFIMALTSSIFQGVGFIRGANVTVYAPDRILIYLDEFPNGISYVRVAAQINYINSGQMGQDSIVKSESITFKIADRRVDLQWQSFLNPTRQGDLLVPQVISDARPFPILGGSGTGHFTSFLPSPIRCKNIEKNCDQYINFMDEKFFLANFMNQKTIEFKFNTSFLNNKYKKHTTCYVDINENVAKFIVSNSWVLVPCWDPKSDK